MDIYNYRQILPNPSFYVQSQLFQCQTSFPQINFTSLSPTQDLIKPKNTIETYSLDLEEEENTGSNLLKQSKKIMKQEPSDSIKGGNQKKPRAKRDLWKSHEDEQLLKLVEKYGQKWTQIGRKIGGRTCKQVRDRYLNNLRPNINTLPFSKKEDEKLISLYLTMGTKWRVIADQMPGRTESQVKNRFHIYLKESLPDTLKNDISEKTKKNVKKSAASRRPLSHSTVDTIEQSEKEDANRLLEDVSEGSQEEEDFVQKVMKPRKNSFATLQREFFEEEEAPLVKVYEEVEGVDSYEARKTREEIKDYLNLYERLYGSMAQMQFEEEEEVEIL